MPPFERKNPPPCPHEAEFGEATVWPDDVSLTHLDNCLTPDGRLQVWKAVRRMADAGSRCVLEDHAGHLAMLKQMHTTDDAYIRTIRQQLRELIAEGSRDGAHIREQLQAVLGGTVVQIVERLD
jgi:hypothetical protein